MSSNGRISTSNEELLTVRELQRCLAGRMKELQAGDVEKLVVTKHGEMVAVVLTVEDYLKLQERGKE